MEKHEQIKKAEPTGSASFDLMKVLIVFHYTLFTIHSYLGNPKVSTT